MNMSITPEKGQRRNSKNVPYLYAGVDIGAGNFNGCFGSYRQDFPSFVVEAITDDLDFVPSRGYVEYLDGPRHDLTDTAWAVGQTAIDLDERFCETPGMSDDGKPKLALQLVLGAIALMDIPQDWNLKMAVSSHIPRQHADLLREKLSGRHVIRVHQDKVVNITIEVLGVVPEGAFVIENLRLPGLSVVYDFGNLTTATTVVRQKGKESWEILSRTEFRTGVSNLHRAIAESQKFYQAIERAGSVSDIDKAIRSGNFSYGETLNLDISSVYRVALRKWANGSITQARQSVADYLANARQYAIGGGCLLPGFDEILRSQSIQPASQSPNYANAESLKYMAAVMDKEQAA